MTQSLRTRLARFGLPIIIALYLVVGTLYATYTPAWQAPDEPAHYNYVRYVANEHRFPVLKLGDYPASYLEEIKAARFPAGMSIDPMRYEFHQPPLYYLLIAPFYQAFGGWLFPLRLLSVAIAAVLLLVVGWTVQELAPELPWLALGVTAIVAFLPMHLAMTAAVNNDTLAELILATVLLLTICYLKASAEPSRQEDTRLIVLLGITTGLGFLTKTAAYIAPVLVLAAVAARHLWLDRDPPPAVATLKAILLYLLPAMGLGLPWWVRNVAVYGGFDFLGLGRHGQVVVGQLRTAEFIATHGTGKLLRDLVLTSFHSFWGQFGWMGVLLDQRLYQVLAILSTVAGVGFVAWIARKSRERATACPAVGVPARWQWAAGGLLALSGLLTLASYLWYNTQFVQHQGRYLFPALVPIGLAFALGWREALRWRFAVPVAALLAMPAVILRLVGWLPNWPFLMLCVTSAAFVLRGFLPRRFDPFVPILPYLLLVPLDVVCLFLFVIPQLAA